MDTALEQRFTIFETALAELAIAMQAGFARIEKGLTLINHRVDAIDIRLTDVERQLGKVEVALVDLQDEVAGLSRAIDKDAVTLINHEKRIKLLEKAH